jgi:hypothetical protein
MRPEPALLAALVLAGCGQGAQESEAPAPEPAPAMAAAQLPDASAAPAPAPEPEPAPAPAVDGLTLHGLTGGGAVIGYGDGRQRFVRLGRDVLPGLTLAEIRQHHALLAAAGGATFELGFGGPAEAADGGGAPAAAPAPAAPGAAAAREATLRYRMGLEPRREGARIAGFAIRAGADLPLLAQAGLRPGDVILKVNGAGFDSEERVLDLHDDLANAPTIEIEYLRAGRRQTARLAQASSR